MKKFKLIFILVFLLILSPLKAQINAYFGDSELKGLVGLEAQTKHLSLSGGVRPAKIPTGNRIYSYSVAGTYYYTGIKKHIFYLSAGLASKGMTKQVGLWEYNSTHSFIATLGIREFPFDFSKFLVNRLKVDGGFGINSSKYGNLITFDMLLNFSLIK
jgi:hypothetical protein